MKKYFRFFGIALLATALCVGFASCGDKNDDDSTEQGGGSGEQGGGGQPGGNGSVTVNLNGVANYTSPQDSLIAFYGETIAVLASQRSGRWTAADSYSIYFPHAKVILTAATGQYDQNGASVVYFTGDFYRLGQQAGDPDMQKYGDWMIKSNLSANVTAFNTSSLTVSATASGLMYNQYQGFVNYASAVNNGTAEQSDEELQRFTNEAPTANMNITINNVTLKNMNAKAFVKGTAIL